MFRNYFGLNVASMVLYNASVVLSGASMVLVLAVNLKTIDSIDSIKPILKTDHLSKILRSFSDI